MKQHYYKCNEYVGGRIEHVTPCPYGLFARYTNRPIMVGDNACEKCEYHKGKNQQEQSVSCSYNKPKH